MNFNLVDILENKKLLYNSEIASSESSSNYLKKIYIQNQQNNDFIFKIINISQTDLVYKLFVIIYQLNRIYNFNFYVNRQKQDKCPFKNYIIRNSTCTLKFGQIIQNIIHLGIINANILTKIFLEWEFFFERKKHIHFQVEKLFDFFILFCFINISSLLDQTEIEHLLSISKSILDSKIDIHGIKKTSHSSSDCFFLENYSIFYDYIILNTFYKNNSVYEPMCKVTSNFSINFQNRFLFSDFEIKIKIIKGNLHRLSLYSCLNIKKKLKKNDSWFKIQKIFFFFMGNSIFNRFKKDINIILFVLIDLYWFQLSIRKVHLINHLLAEFSFFPNICDEQTVHEKNQKTLMLHHFCLNNTCNITSCSIRLMKRCVKFSMSFDIKIRDFVLNLLSLLLNNMNSIVNLKSLILICKYRKDRFFCLELFKKIIRYNCKKLFTNKKFLKYFYQIQNCLEDYNQNFLFFKKLFEIVTTNKKNLLEKINFFFKNNFLSVRLENYLIIVILSVLLSEVPIYLQMIILEEYKELILFVTKGKSCKFFCLRTLFLLGLQRPEVFSSIVLEKLNYYSILNITNMGRAAVYEKEFLELSAVSFFEKSEVFVYILEKKKIIVKRDKKFLKKLIISGKFTKRRIIFFPYLKTKKVEKTLNYKIEDIESSMIEFLDLFLNQLHEKYDTYFFLSLESKINYIKWYILYKLSILFKKRTNILKVKFIKKIQTRKTIFFKYNNQITFRK
nr:hypothetical protein 1634Bnrm3_p095 [Cryptomonas sp.]